MKSEDVALVSALGVGAGLIGESVVRNANIPVVNIVTSNNILSALLGLAMVYYGYKTDHAFGDVLEGVGVGWTISALV